MSTSGSFGVLRGLGLNVYRISESGSKRQGRLLVSLAISGWVMKSVRMEHRTMQYNNFCDFLVNL